MDSSSSSPLPADESTDLASSTAGSCGVPGASVSTRQDKLRSLLDLVFLAIVLSIFAVIASKRLAAPTDPDLWWHLRTGSWIVQHGAVPHFDVFGAWTLGKPWVDYSWLFEIFVFKIFNAWGPGGIVLFTCVLVVADMALLGTLLNRYTYLARALTLTLLAYVATFESLGTPRPWLVTTAFFTLELLLLLVASERGKWQWLCPIVPLMALWANVHIQFVYGLALLGLFALMQTIPGAGYPAAPTQNPRRRLSCIPFWAVLVASALATLANPFGWRVYAVVYEYATQKSILTYVSEMQSPSFRTPLDFLMLGFVCAAWFLLGKTPRRSILLIMLLAAATYCGFHAARDLWFLSIVASLVLAQWWGTGDMHIRPAGPLTWAGAIAVSLLLPFAVPGVRVSDQEIDKWMRDLYPVQACDYIERHHAIDPLYNSFPWGGYLMWRLPQLHVSIDGRTNVHDDWRVTRAIETSHGELSWTKDDELFRAKTIVLEKKRPLTSILRSDPRFRLVYEDNTAVVFEPTSQPEMTHVPAS